MGNNKFSKKLWHPKPHAKNQEKLMRQILRKTGDVCEGPIRQHKTNKLTNKNTYFNQSINKRLNIKKSRFYLTWMRLSYYKKRRKTCKSSVLGSASFTKYTNICSLTNALR